MTGPMTWLWNIKHRKLIEETKAIIRLYEFLRYDCGLKEADKFSAKELREVLNIISKPFRKAKPAKSQISPSRR
jgi:hypothetical protein